MLTGAVMPAGADTVALQEEVTVEADDVAIPRRPEGAAPTGGGPARTCARARSSWSAGARLRPQDIGLAAELGSATLPVFAPLEVAMLSTGDELRRARRRAPSAVPSTTPTASSCGPCCTSLPVEVTDLGILPDDAGRGALRPAPRPPPSHDVILTSGGASRGDEDHVVRSVAALGRLDFWQIAMKPGRPLAFGRLGDAVFVGLPGNPVAAMVCFLLFARPVLLRLAGAAWREPRRPPGARRLSRCASSRAAASICARRLDRGRARRPLARPRSSARAPAS